MNLFPLSINGGGVGSAGWLESFFIAVPVNRFKVQAKVSQRDQVTREEYGLVSCGIIASFRVPVFGSLNMQTPARPYRSSPCPPLWRAPALLMDAVGST